MTDQGQKAFRTAQGYLELGMPEDAAGELATIPAMDRQHPGVRQMEVIVFMKLLRWEEALASAVQLCELESTNAGGFIHRAFCLHELGRTEEARTVLLDGPPALKEEPIYYYNLGCYEAVLGRQEEALRLVRRSISQDYGLLEVARTDDDLKSIWPILSEDPEPDTKD